MDGLGEPQAAPCIGKQLRAQRIRTGLALSELAYSLHIRQRLLEAIEAGAYHHLPAGVYAEGFVRAYAREVGLDPDVVMERFRLETGGLDRSVPTLTFPDPQPETGIPNGAILFLGALIAIVSYASWYLSSGTPAELAQSVAPLPARFEERFLAADPAATLPSVPREAPFVPGIASAPADGAGNVGVLPGAPPVELPSFAPAAGTPLPPRPHYPLKAGMLASPAESPAVAGPQAVPQMNAAGAPAPAPAAPTPPAPTPPAVETLATSQASGASADALATATPPSQARMALAAEPPHDEGAAPGGDGRVVLHARSDSWVEVRDSARNTLVTARLLRAGESYRLPDRPGLRLLTGNAGGLQVFVDGQPAPPLGRDGTVRRNIPLDAALLTAALDRPD